MTDEDKNPRNTKPISLHPLTPDEALRHALSVSKEEVEASERAEKERLQRERKAKARKK